MEGNHSPLLSFPLFFFPSKLSNIALVFSDKKVVFISWIKEFCYHMANIIKYYFCRIMKIHEEIRLWVFNKFMSK